jgi:hypothetical protein
MHGGQASLAVFFDLVPWHEIPELLIADERNLVDFVGGAKAIHEMQKGYSRVERRDLRNDRHVVCLLHRKGGYHGQSAATDDHRVTVVSIDGKCLTRQRPRGNVDDRGEEFAGNLVKIGNVEQQALRGREGRGERARNESSVKRSS